MGAPQKVRNYLNQLTSAQKEFAEIGPEVVNLGDIYIREMLLEKRAGRIASMSPWRQYTKLIF